MITLLNIIGMATFSGFVLEKEFSFGLIRSAFIVALVMLSVEDVRAQSSNTTSSQQIIQSIPCRGKMEYYRSGKIRTCYLSKDYEKDGNILSAGSKLFFEENGNLTGCRICKESKFYGVLFPAKTCVFFNRWGHRFSFWLPEDTRIQGHLIAATSDGIGNSLHLNGKLKAIWLADDEEISGVPCSSSMNIFRFGSRVLSLGTKRMVWFYDNGQLQQAMLARDVTIQGHSFKKGDLIYFDKDGRIDLNSKNIE